MHTAARAGRRGAVALLLERQDIDLECSNDVGESPLAAACRSGFDDMATMLSPFVVERERDMSTSEEDGGGTSGGGDTSPMSGRAVAKRRPSRASAPAVAYSERRRRRSSSLPVHVPSKPGPRHKAYSDPVKPIATTKPSAEDLLAVTQALRRLDLFPAEIDLTVHAGGFERILVKKGHQLMTQGRSFTQFHVLLEGTLSVLQDRPGGQRNVRVSVLRPGACFGDCSILSHNMCMTSVVCESEYATLCRLDPWSFETLVTKLTRAPSRAGANGNSLTSIPSGGSTTSVSDTVSEAGGMSLSHDSSFFGNAASALFSPRRKTTLLQRVARRVPFTGANKRRRSVKAQRTRSGALSLFLTDYRDVSQSQEVGPDTQRNRMAALRSSKKQGLAGAARGGERVAYPDCPPDLVVRASGADGSGPLVVTAGSEDRLLQVLILSQFEGDVNFPSQFLQNYRGIVEPAMLLRRLVQAFETSEELESRQRILRVMCLWTRKKPFCLDPELHDDPTLKASIVAFVRGIDADCPKELRQYVETLLSDHLADPPPSPASGTEAAYQIHVEIVRPGGGHTRIISVNVPPDMTFGTLCQHICHTRSLQRGAHLDRQFSATDSEYMDPNSYEFRVKGLGFFLGMELNVRDTEIHSVRFVPSKSNSDPNDCTGYIEPTAVAHMLTATDFATFAAITPAELRGCLWVKAPERATHIWELTQRFNQVTSWAVRLILMGDTPADRAKMIGVVIEISEQFLYLRNFHGVIQMQSALKHVAVRRLKKSWKAVPPKSMSIFRVLEEMINPAKNRQAYRQRLEGMPKLRERTFYDFTPTVRLVEPALPFLGFFLSDFYFVESGNSNSVPAFVAKDRERPEVPGDEEMLVNFFKVRGVSSLLLQLQMYQGTPYTSDTISHFHDQAFVREFFRQSPLINEEKVFEKSRLLEPLRANESGLPLVSPETERVGQFVWKTVEDQQPDLEGLLTPHGSGAGGGGGGGGGVVPHHDHRHHRGGVLRRGSVRRFVTADEPITNALTYLGTVPCRHNPVEAKRLIASSKVRPRQVTVDVQPDALTVADIDTRENLVRRDIPDIYGYRLELANHMLFFGAVEKTTGNKFCHVFRGSNQALQDVFSDIHATMQQHSLLSMETSTAARTEVEKRLLDPSAHLPDGAFVLRDSTSQRRAYSLGLKHGDSVTHLLITRSPQEDGEVTFQFKDAKDEERFNSLRSLLTFYSQSPNGLPCALNLTSAQLLTHDLTSSVDAGKPSVVPSQESLSPKPASSCPWYADLSRSEAGALLEAKGMREGTFLVRPSSSGGYALSFVYNQDVVHMLLEEVEEGILVDGQLCAATVVETVEQLLQRGELWLPLRLVTGPPSTSSGQQRVAAAGRPATAARNVQCKVMAAIGNQLRRSKSRSHKTATSSVCALMAPWFPLSPQAGAVFRGSSLVLDALAGRKGLRDTLPCRRSILTVCFARLPESVAQASGTPGPARDERPPETPSDTAAPPARGPVFNAPATVEWTAPTTTNPSSCSTASASACMFSSGDVSIV